MRAPESRDDVLRRFPRLVAHPVRCHLPRTGSIFVVGRYTTPACHRTRRSVQDAAQ